MSLRRTTSPQPLSPSGEGWAARWGQRALPFKRMTLIERQPASHWYLRDGRPFHEIAKKDGSGNRPVTLADARKVMALPSVTNVLGVLAKPGLEAWKIEQGIIAALTLPRLSGETLDGFA